ncbi:MAG: class I SAM-dependent methyltransferase [Candidatus Berkiella sp.]
MKNNNQRVENAIESSPTWLKESYIGFMRFIKKCLHALGLLKKLDKLATSSQRFHYLRSLLAIHQLDDMIQLDVPWWTYQAISEIEDYIKNLNYKPVVFEYGSGASTIWLAKRCDKVIAIEHDGLWYQKLKTKLSAFPDVSLSLQTPENKIDKYHSVKVPNASFKTYVESIKTYESVFDIIIIDGRCRSDCLETSLQYLKPGGIIVFDNSNRKRYQSALKNNNLLIQRFYGYVPGSPFKSETAILRKQV